MDQKIINLFDEYTHAPLSREVFLKRLAKLTGGTAAAMAVLPLLEVNYAHAASLETDEDIVTEEISYPGQECTMQGLLARPARVSGKLGSVVVIHENRGLNPHTKDIARRLAKAGFMALAPNALSVFGGTPDNDDEARTLIGKLDAQQNLKNFVKAFDYLGTRTEANGKMACMGFCWGGAMANQLAIHTPNLRVSIPFYGRQAAVEDVPRIGAKLQLHYGEFDERVNAGIPAYEAALKAAGKPYELYMYLGAQHAFMNDAAPTRYHEPSAKLAWERVLTILNQEIR
jgi:carboxymethylenebutenolidase